ncbi:hypothetical protein [Pelagimonas varians]|uniref:Uncharacterized protein n=1 Tax=Pelagimonas varians TaxID=696760 RepID=A0A238KRZ8_9RHOB|nr:hypothetical protein [Pelagimonas varians]PYG28637.1 hypothetical protein C8N36_111137 [Pelagimonas varians]SMX45498.1 hypothetical protein PEV8663_03058 [Pelagimonas varians]
MIITLLALATLVATMFLILGNLRVVARDTYDVLANFTQRAQAEGQLVPSLAFGALWLLIFALSCF